MNPARFISARLSAKDGTGFTAAVTKIAVMSIAAGLAIMLIAFAILEGFRYEIRSKIVSFGGHLQVSKFDTDNTYEEMAVDATAGAAALKNVGNIRMLQSYARKTAIIKTDEEVAGVVLKGVGRDYNLQAFHRLLQSGKPLVLTDTAESNDILISNRLATRLKLKPGDDVVFYFIQQPPRFRKLKVAGIFETGLEEFDDTYVIGDLRQVQQLNGWKENEIGGFELLVNNFNDLDKTAAEVENKIPYDLQVSKITEIYVQLFDWLALLRKNVQIFIILIMVVATFNMVSTLFILILERTQMIGLLKALGATDLQIREIFFYKGLNLTFKGLLLGNVIGLGFCALQYFTHFIPLDPENYY
ncbi:MAG: ABC transporter permease, partial [Moraxellaceae bacterium]